MPDPRVLAYHNAAAAYEKTKVTLHHFIDRVHRADERLKELGGLLAEKPRVPRLQEDEWPAREEVNRAIRDVRDARKALRDAWQALTPEERAQVPGLPS